MQSIQDKIVSRIMGMGRGTVIVPSQFLDLGSREAVDLALHRLVNKDAIRRLARGLYDYPKTHPILGVLSPSPEAIATALVGKDKIRLQPSGAYAANLLRLSEQVPAHVLFLTDGPSRKVRVGQQTIELRRTTPRNMAMGKSSGMLIQAMRYLGKEYITQERVEPLRNLLPAADKKQVLKDLRLAPAWMHRYLRYIAGEEAAE
jgi:hypothetical protein